MYIDQEHRVVILYPHKTGTHTIRNILKDHGKIPYIRYVGDNNHPSLEQLRFARPEVPDILEYDVYAFYREPVEKFLSFMAYNQRHFALIPTPTVMDYVMEYGIFAPQVRWLTHPTVNINLLDYEKFETELRGLLRKIGIPDSVPIPHLNSSPLKKKPADITQEEIDFIKSWYPEDYAFFDSKGIKFKI
jgi:hypothetical protein